MTLSRDEITPEQIPCFRKIIRKRPFFTRDLYLGVYRLPIPGQELVEAVGGMTVGHALQDV